jgi:hypothetical protein
MRIVLGYYVWYMLSQGRTDFAALCFGVKEICIVCCALSLLSISRLPNERLQKILGARHQNRINKPRICHCKCHASMYELV